MHWQPFRPRTVALAAAVALTVLAGAALARTVYVKSRYAKVREGLASTSAIVGTVQIGQALEVVAEKPGFVQVKLAGGKTGWLSTLWTDPNPPAAESHLAKIGKAARADGKEVSYTAGARGLSPESKAYAQDKPGGPEIAAAIERLEQVKVDDDTLDAFLKAGKLGDYREATK